MTLLTELLAQDGRPDGVSGRGPDLLPLDAGEQYRFSFAMDACIGCHSCEVACAEQNGNPVGVNWRRVGEVEGGEYPHTKRFSLSTACNHCLEPTCLTGCPTNAYVKLTNGIVAHHAADCIGCQYCIWNCPYEVPVFNPQRRVVTKCDLCQPRLAGGDSPACVEACPTHAIKVEKVNVAQWRADHHEADAPGLPTSAITLSTTRIIQPVDMPARTRPVYDDHAEPADPHWPLIAVTILTQASLGAVIAAVALQASAGGNVGGGAAAAAGAGLAALAASVFHLGRPAHAWKALRNLRRSWLSREVALFSLFSFLSVAYAGSSLFAVGEAATVLGLAGVYASGRLYLVPARPVWNSGRTLVAFFATALALGPLVVLLLVGGGHVAPQWIRLLLGSAALGSLVQLAVIQHLVASIVARREREFSATARLLFGRFRLLFWLRVAGALASIVGCLLAMATPYAVAPVVAVLLLAAAGEVTGRYLFFVTVTPMTAARRFAAGSA